MNDSPSATQKIVVIQTAFLGDVIMSTPLIRAIRHTFPNAKIDILTIPATGIVFKHNPYINEILHFDKRKPLNKLISFFRVISQFRKRHYDLAISIQSSYTSSFLMLFGGIKQRVGFARQKLLSSPVTHKRGYHVRIRYLKLLKPFVRQDFDAQTEIFFSDAEESSATEIVSNARSTRRYVIGIAPGSVWPTKQWPQQYYTELLQMLTGIDANVLLIGGPEEQELCQQIKVDANSDALNYAGKLSVLESAAVISKIDLMICNDSAPLHIANAVQTDVFAFFGPTVRRFGCYPYRPNDKILEIDLYCRPCGKHGGNHCPEKHFRCMLAMTPEMVFRQINSYFEGKAI